MTEIMPRDVLERLLRRWYFIALGAVLGGALGLLASLALPPVYEAHAEVYLLLDSALWAQEDHPGDPVEIAIANSTVPIFDLFYTPQTLDALIAAAGAEGIPLDRETVYADFTIQRLNMTWQLTVRAGSPATAARLADLWAATALPVHQAAHDHALAAYALTLQRDALTACFAGVNLSQGNACADTNFSASTDLSTAVAALETQITAERLLSLGLDPALSLEMGLAAVPPASPVRYARSWLLLAGAALGLLLGVVVSQGAFPQRKKHVGQS